MPALRRHKHWIPPGGLLAGFLGHGLSWVTLLIIAVRSPPTIGLAPLAWLHLVTLGWLTTLALSVLIHVVPTFTKTRWKGESVARGSLVIYGIGVAALVGAFWCGATWMLPWAAGFIFLGLSSYFVPTAWTLIAGLRKPAVEAAIARALLFTLASLMVAGAIGVMLAFALHGQLPARLLQHGPAVHATFGIIGWLTVLVTGVSTRTLGPIAGARARFPWVHIAVGAAQVGGLLVTVAGLTLSVTPLVWGGAALIGLSALLYAANVADVLRRASVPHRPPQAFAGAAAIWFVVGIALALAAFGNVPTGPSAIYVLLVGWIGQMTNGHVYHIGVRLIATMARGDDDETRPGELLAGPLSWGSFFLFQAAVSLGAIALSLDFAHLLAAGALCGCGGWLLMAANIITARRRAQCTSEGGQSAGTDVLQRVRSVRLDVRQLPVWQRHPMIFSAFDSLAGDQSMVLVNDHEPRPLRLQFEELRPGRFSWSPRNLGNDRWEVEIRRVAPAENEPSGSLLTALRRSMLFGEADEATQMQLADLAIYQHHTRGTVVMAQGDLWPFVGIVCEGTLAIISGSAEGREHLLYEVLPLETFGELAALDDGATFGSASVISRTALVALIPRSAFLRAFANDAALARSLSRVGAQRVRVLVERSTAQVSQPTLARVAAAILPYASPDRGLSAVLPPLDVLSLADLAIAAGTVREVVGRALLGLERAHAIERVRGHVVRVDRERLSTFL
jgi:uncharacterized protein (DUF2249 family)/CRP-like cAMP-binding protein